MDGNAVGRVLELGAQDQLIALEALDDERLRLGAATPVRRPIAMCAPEPAVTIARAIVDRDDAAAVARAPAQLPDLEIALFREQPRLADPAVGEPIEGGLSVGEPGLIDARGPQHLRRPD